jgi:hypothetical protein
MNRTIASDDAPIIEERGSEREVQRLTVYISHSPSCFFHHDRSRRMIPSILFPVGKLRQMQTDVESRFTPRYYTILCLRVQL